MTVWFYTILSIVAVSLISLIGILTISISVEKLKKIVLLLVSFSAGALLGDTFIHLIPEVVAEHGFSIDISIMILAGIASFFVIEKIVHWRHCHLPTTKAHAHSFAITNLIGDGVHNFIDGTIIAASYLVSIPVGIATTIAVVIHEIPQEIGDFGVLLHGGFSRARALFYNLITGITAVFGGVATLLVSNYISDLTLYLVPFAAGGFIYIASTDLIPELHKEVALSKSLMQFISFVSGIIIMYVLLSVG